MANMPQRPLADDRRNFPSKESNAQGPLPPAALDHSEEGSGAGSFPSSGVATNILCKPLDGVDPVTKVPEAFLRFSENDEYKQIGRGHIDPRAQYISVPTLETGSASYPRDPSHSIPSTGRSNREESISEDIPSLSRQEVSTPSFQAHPDQLANPTSDEQLSRSTANNGVNYPEIDQFSQRRHRICIAIQSSDGGPLQPESPLAHAAPEARGVNVKVSDYQQNTRQALSEKIKESLVRSHGPRQGHSSSHSVEKVKLSHKSVHETGGKSRRNSGAHHMIRCTPVSSKTTQPNTANSIVVSVSPMAVKVTSHPPLMGDEVPDPWVPGVDEEETHIEEVSENTENISTVRSSSESRSDTLPIDNFAVTEASEFAPDKTSHFSVSNGVPPSQGILETSGSADPPDSSQRKATRDLQPSLRGAARAIAALKARKEPEKGRNESGRQQLQTTACVSDDICKDVRSVSPGKRYGLYTSRVGYIGAPRPPIPKPVTASRQGA